MEERAMSRSEDDIVIKMVAKEIAQDLVKQGKVDLIYVVKFGRKYPKLVKLSTYKEEDMERELQERRHFLVLEEKKEND